MFTAVILNPVFIFLFPFLRQVAQDAKTVGPWRVKVRTRMAKRLTRPAYALSRARAALRVCPTKRGKPRQTAANRGNQGLSRAEKPCNSNKFKANQTKQDFFFSSDDWILQPRRHGMLERRPDSKHHD
jgi:hypothetical protein